MTSHTDRRRGPAWAARGAVALALLAPIGGCNIVGPAMIIIEGPGEVEAAYKLDPERATVIFVDDPASKIAQRRIRAQIGSAAQDVLLRKKLVREGKMIDSRSTIAVADQRGDDGLLAVTEIGEAVGAEVVIYVLVTRFDVISQSQDMAPTAEIEVKIFDVPSQARVWPASEKGYPSTFSRRTTKVDAARTRTGALQAQSDLAQLTGEGLAQLFYDVERPQSLRR
jgi:hypothetical protein